MRLPPTRVTTAIVVATISAWALAALTRQTEMLAVLAGFIPARVGGLVDLPGAVPVIFTPLTAALIHGGLLHVAFNMLMLGYCGRLTEVALGGRGMALLYGIGAFAAAGTQYLGGPSEMTPMIGASGAVSAVIGAYAILYGQPKAMPKGWPAKLVNVVWLAAAWIGLQFLVGLGTIGTGVTIALAAHIGGFFAGLALARPLLLLRYRRA